MAKDPGKKDGKKKRKHPILKAILIILVVVIAAAGIFIYRAYQEYLTETDSTMAALIGSEAPDFTVQTTDGEGFTLSEALESRELVLLNVFASWCGPCENEFPEFEKVYQKYQGKMEIIAISGDSDDTMEVITDYKKSHGLSFPMGIAEGNVDFVPVSGYPTTVLIDRTGKVVFCQSGTIPNETILEDLVTGFLGDSYDGKPVYLYTIATHNDKEYVGGVSIRLTAEDGSTAEVTTAADGFAYLKTNEPHTYTMEITGLPDGYSGGDTKGKAGPNSGWTTILLKAK